MKIYNDYEMYDYLDSDMEEGYDATIKKWVSVDDLPKELEWFGLGITIDEKKGTCTIQSRKEFFNSITEKLVKMYHKELRLTNSKRNKGD